MSSSLKKSFKKDKSGFILLFSGLFLLLVFSVWRFHQIRILSFKVEGYESQAENGVVPTYIKMYPLGVDIKIKESVIVDGVWQVFPDAVSHLSSSSGIGGGGNIILYGHNKNEILGPIRWAKEGAVIDLFDEAGNKYSYQVVKTDTVNPDNLSYILPTSEETLTLYTCVGFLDTQRFVVVAKKVKF